LFFGLCWVFGFFYLNEQLGSSLVDLAHQLSFYLDSLVLSIILKIHKFITYLTLPYLRGGCTRHISAEASIWAQCATNSLPIGCYLSVVRSHKHKETVNNFWHDKLKLNCLVQVFCWVFQRVYPQKPVGFLGISWVSEPCRELRYL